MGTMKKRLKEEKAEKILHSDAFVGHIVRLASVAESRLDILLAHYFLKREGFEYFEDFLLLVTERLGFSAKIEIFAKIQLVKEIPSRAELPAKQGCP